MFSLSPNTDTHIGGGGYSLSAPLAIISNSDPLCKRPSFIHSITHEGGGGGGPLPALTEEEMVMEVVETFTHREMEINESAFRHFREFILTDTEADLESEYSTHSC